MGLARTSRYLTVCFSLSVVSCSGNTHTVSLTTLDARSDCPSASVPASSPAVSAAPSASVSVPTLVAATAEPPPITSWPARIEVEILPAQPACALTVQAGLGEEDAITWTFRDVVRVSAEEGPTCAKATIFDSATEPKPYPEDAPSLPYVRIAKAGRVLDVEANASDELHPSLIDANFDGALDLMCLGTTGMYTTSYKFWLFDRRTRKLVRNAALEGLMSPQFDARKKMIFDGGRVSGPVYRSSSYGWIDGNLETLTSETAILGETPDQKPLPDGFTSWTTRYERVGRVLKKVFDGPTGSAPP
ncbi:MAG: hypothetical protein U0414_33880 [Polyangiaceae bacterium]